MRSRESTRLVPSGADPGKLGSKWQEEGASRVEGRSDRLTELTTLMGVSTLLSSGQPLPEALESACHLISGMFGAQVCFVHLIDGDDDPVCVGRHFQEDSVPYAWEGLARIYGRKAIQKQDIVSCSKLVRQREGELRDTLRSTMGGVCAIPLQGTSKIVGSLSVGYANSHRFSAHEKDMLTALGSQVAMAVERSWILDQLRGQVARANSLREVALQIGSNLRLEALLESIVDRATVLLASEYSAIFLADRRLPGEDPVWGIGKESGRANGRPVRLVDVPLGSTLLRAIETSRPALAQNVRDLERLNQPSEEEPCYFRAAVAVPLLSNREVLGALIVCYVERRPFDSSDLGLAEDFAALAALAIRNAQMYENALESFAGLESAISQISNHGISLLDDRLNMTFANSATFWLLGQSPRRGVVPLGEWTAAMRRALVEGAELDWLVERIRDNPGETVTARLETKGSQSSIRAIKLVSLPIRQADGTILGRVNLMEETG